MLVISTRQGPHHVAQKLIITIFFPRRASLSLTVFPVVSANSKSGIGSPIFSAATGLFSRRSSFFTAILKTANKHKNKIVAAVFIVAEFHEAKELSQFESSGKRTRP